ncbi:hypothetical protein BDW66DRAFT_144232 [Aspergillus desertorum]
MICVRVWASLGSSVYQTLEKGVFAGKKAAKLIGIGGIGGRLALLERWFALGATWSLGGEDDALQQAGMRKIT